METSVNNKDKTEKTKISENVDVSSAEEQVVDESLELDRVLKEFESLYNELMVIKDEPDFKIYGFSPEGPYNEWMKKVNTLEDDRYVKLLIRKQLTIGDLKNLGNEYVASKGKETEYTENMIKIINHSIEPKVLEEETEIKTSNEDKLYGEWLVKSNFSSSLDHRCEIYFNGSDYYSIITYKTNETNKENLKKEGNKFYILGNKSGEYYLINPTTQNMKIYDKMGVIDMFTVTKIN